jgi:hypothetical protein
MIQFPIGMTLGGQTAQRLYEITLRQEFAMMNELTGMITVSSGIQTRLLYKTSP